MLLTSWLKWIAVQWAQASSSLKNNFLSSRGLSIDLLKCKELQVLAQGLLGLLQILNLVDLLNRVPLHVATQGELRVVGVELKVLKLPVGVALLKLKSSEPSGNSKEPKLKNAASLKHQALKIHAKPETAWTS